jgi:hypothetical protein
MFENRTHQNIRDEVSEEDDLPENQGIDGKDAAKLLSTENWHAAARHRRIRCKKAREMVAKKRG